MTWNGYFEYAGTEIINVTRTETYAKNAGLTWFRPVYKTDALPYMLGDGLRYRTPMVDDAPWVDPDIPESLDFYGVYPLDVGGIEDSTRGSTVVQSLTDGGIPGRIRHATKTAVFSAVLVAATEASAEYGFKWLKQALLGGACGTPVSSACNGADLCYLSSEPDMEIPAVNEVGVQALFDGGFFAVGDPISNGQIDGAGPNQPTPTVVDAGGPAPTPVTDPRDDIEGGFPEVTGGTLQSNPYMIQVDAPDIDGGSATSLHDMEFDGGTVFETGGFFDGRAFPFNYDSAEAPEVDPEDCLTPYMRRLTRVVFNSGPTITAKRETTDGGNVWTVQFTAVAGNPYELGPEVPVIAGFMDPNVPMPWALGYEPDAALIDLEGYIHEETACAVTEYQPIFDPLYPTLIPPPGPPSVPLGVYNPPLNWRRRQFTIPKTYVPLWGEVVPKIGVHARTGDLRNLRLRFYADPFNVGSIEDDPCAFCGDIVISYVPQDHTLVLDGSTQTVYVVTPGGGQRRADSLVFKTDGTPFEWPTLSCGFGYVVTLDLPQTQEPPVVDLSLFARAV